MFWEFYQQSRINEAKSTASRAETKSQALTVTVRQLEDKLDSLALTCQALWEIVRDRTDVTEEELVAKISEIDLRDGVADGKMGISIVKCEKCGRNLNRRHGRCMYCGQEVDKDHVFQG